MKPLSISDAIVDNKPSRLLVVVRWSAVAFFFFFFHFIKTTSVKDSVENKLVNLILKCFLLPVNITSCVCHFECIIYLSRDLCIGTHSHRMSFVCSHLHTLFGTQEANRCIYLNHETKITH